MNKIRVGDCLHHRFTDTWFTVERILDDGSVSVSWEEENGPQSGCLSDYSDGDYDLFEEIKEGEVVELKI